jgi:hypothetical protein
VLAKQHDSCKLIAIATSRAHRPTPDALSAFHRRDVNSSTKYLAPRSRSFALWAPRSCADWSTELGLVAGGLKALTKNQPDLECSPLPKFKEQVCINSRGSPLLCYLSFVAMSLADCGLFAMQLKLGITPAKVNFECEMVI